MAAPEEERERKWQEGRKKRKKGFQHDEMLVSTSNAVLADGTTLPAAVGNSTVFAGYPMTDLKTAVETAVDLTQMQAQINLVGTVFGVAPLSVTLPFSINLANEGFLRRKSISQEYVLKLREEKLGIVNPDFEDWKQRLAELLKEAGKTRDRKVKSLENLIDPNSKRTKKEGTKRWL